MLIFCLMHVLQKGLSFDEMKKQIGEDNVPLAQVKDVSERQNQLDHIYILDQVDIRNTQVRYMAQRFHTICVAPKSLLR